MRDFTLREGFGEERMARLSRQRALTLRLGRSLGTVQ